LKLLQDKYMQCTTYKKCIGIYIMNICISCFIMMQENKKMLNRPHTRPISLGCRAQLFIPIHLLFNGIDGVLVLINTTRNPSFLRILRPPPQQSAVALLSLSRSSRPTRCPRLLQASTTSSSVSPSSPSQARRWRSHP